MDRLRSTLTLFALTLACIAGGAMALAGTLWRDTKTEGAVDVPAGMALSIPQSARPAHDTRAAMGRKSRMLTE